MIDEANAERVGGAALILSAIGTVVAMGHHPSGAHSGALGGVVHGAMIALVLAMTWGFIQFALVRGIWRPLVSAGLLAYGVSLFGHLGAATINGFVVPALADRGHGAVSHDLFLFAWTMNQSLAKLGVAMTGIAFIAWGIDLLGDRSRVTKAVGGLGLIAGAVPATLLLSGIVSRLDVKAALMTYALHAAWAALVGIQLLRGRIARAAVA